MNWPAVGTLTGTLTHLTHRGSLVLEARDGDVATYQLCTDPACPHIKPDTEHAHLILVERGKG